MQLESQFDQAAWCVRKIAVVGAGIVGVPMAAMLAQGRICQGSDRAAHVIIIQRNSPSSGWKVDAINSGQSSIGGIEPQLDEIVRGVVSERLMSASHDYSVLRDADVILVCVQTDRQGFRPEYRPMFEALSNIASELQKRPAGKKPLIIFESTLAPSSMTTLIKKHFEDYGLRESVDVFLGNSPNRVMSGRLVERIRTSDKIVAGLNPQTPKLIHTLYSKIVTDGHLHLTNSMTAEVVKTLENAYRDVRIAYTAEISRYCDDSDIDFYKVREEVNKRLSWTDSASVDPNAVPAGGLLIPTIGVGGHCLPKDGILLLWRLIEAGEDMSASLILEARRINDESPAEAICLMEKHSGSLSGKKLALMGAAYRFNSEDTRNSPTLVMAQQLLDKECQIVIHDFFVKPDDQNLISFGLQKNFTHDLDKALLSSEVLVFCTSHRRYLDEMEHIMHSSHQAEAIFDGCNILCRPDNEKKSFEYIGLGKGKNSPTEEFINFVYEGFQTVERGFANEIQDFIHFANKKYVNDDFNSIDFSEVQRLAGTCITGCHIVNPEPIENIPVYKGFSSRLVKCAQKHSTKGKSMNLAY